MTRSGADIVRRTSKTDNYSTPENAVEALFREESFLGVTWEPACGEGNIARVYTRVVGSRMMTSDIRTGHDFLGDPPPFEDVQNVITNPPFSLALDFAIRALEVTKERRGKVALLLRIQFLEGTSRKEFLVRSPLKRVWVFSKRVSMYPEGQENRGGGTQAFAWFVWDWTHRGPPTIGWL